MSSLTGMQHVQSSHSFYVAFNDKEKKELRDREEYTAKISRIIPIIGQIYVWCQDFYICEKFINSTDSIYCKIGFRKFAIRILENSLLNCVIHSIFMTVIWGIATYLDTGSSYAAFLAIGQTFAASFTLMTFPTLALLWSNKQQLAKECLLRNQSYKEELKRVPEETESKM